MIKDNTERCGFCGRFFNGINFLTLEEIKEATDRELNNCPLGYCPDAGAESHEEEEARYVTRDMAIDAGDLSLEGARL
jgi:hypothetical protein